MAEQVFTLDPHLAADSFEICALENVQVRLMDDARYWWLVLVPEIDGPMEWHHLDETARHYLFDVTTHAASVLENLARAEKINIAALGNMVRQLHVHVIARHEGDVAWPGPVWGVGDALPYDTPTRGARTQSLQSLLMA
ncbi:MAG TPA: diadenosine tetraphosphate hydrolase [Rhodobiaceae bacterium]|nr:diadenosine tetraphosphate hydrolase [Rhodobiaceae bacterium]